MELTNTAGPEINAWPQKISLNELKLIAVKRGLRVVRCQRRPEHGGAEWVELRGCRQEGRFGNKFRRLAVYSIS